MKAEGEDIPEPLAEKQLSGKFVVRVPADLHRNLTIEAAEAGDRINAILAGCGFNFRNAYSPDLGGDIRAILSTVTAKHVKRRRIAPDYFQGKITQIWQVVRNIDSGYLTVKMQAV